MRPGSTQHAFNMSFRAHSNFLNSTSNLRATPNTTRLSQMLRTSQAKGDLTDRPGVIPRKPHY